MSIAFLTLKRYFSKHWISKFWFFGFLTPDLCHFGSILLWIHFRKLDSDIYRCAGDHLAELQLCSLLYIPLNSQFKAVVLCVRARLHWLSPMSPVISLCVKLLRFLHTKQKSLQNGLQPQLIRYVRDAYALWSRLHQASASTQSILPCR